MEKTRDVLLIVACLLIIAYSGSHFISGFTSERKSAGAVDQLEEAQGYPTAISLYRDYVTAVKDQRKRVCIGNRGPDYEGDYLEEFCHCRVELAIEIGKRDPAVDFLESYRAAAIFCARVRSKDSTFSAVMDVGLGRY
ncbi:MAG: hypothetical protein OXI44_02710 [Bacteroidota bacterium]|nr:hypothetical protein [Bacteroidota bacterium]